MTQNKIKICDSWIVANITPFLLKIKGGVEVNLDEKKPKTKMKM
jgi:hypothetical protein